MLAKFRDNFITGIAVILPATVTIWLLAIVCRVLNDKLLVPLIKYFQPYLVNVYLEYAAKTAALLLVIAFVTVIGLTTRILFMRRLFSSGEKMFFKIPLLGKIYIAIKEMSKAFFGGHKGIFMAPVLVEYPRKGLYSIGFLTSDSKGEIQNKTGKKLANIFVPTTPNPTTGMLLLAPEDELIRLNMSIEEAMKLIISGGIVAPGEVESRE